MKAPPRPTMTALPPSAASSTTARVSLANRSWMESAGGSSSATAAQQTPERRWPGRTLCAARCWAGARRRSRAVPQECRQLTATCATIARSRNSASNLAASRRPTGRPSAPNWREMVMTGTNSFSLRGRLRRRCAARRRRPSCPWRRQARAPQLPTGRRPPARRLAARSRLSG